MISAEQLKQWTKDATFTANVIESKEKPIDRNVLNSTRMTRAEQAAKGWNNVDLCDLAAAYAAYLIAKKTPLLVTWRELVAGRSTSVSAGWSSTAPAMTYLSTMLRRPRGLSSGN